MDFLAGALIVGSGATAMIDLWAVMRQRLLGIAPPDFGLVGRWLATWHTVGFATIPWHAAPVRAERLVGWLAHYVIGIAFAALLLGLWGVDGCDSRASTLR